MSMVHASRGKLKPASDMLRSEPAIVAGIASVTLPSSTVRWSDMIADYDVIRDSIEAVFPEFSDYSARIRIPGGLRLPLPPLSGCGQPHRERLSSSDSKDWQRILR